MASTPTAATDVVSILVSRLPAPAEMRKIRREVLVEKDVREPLASAVREKSEAGPSKVDRQGALVAGLGSWILGDDTAAVGWLADAGRKTTTRWAHASSLINLGRYAQAIALLEPLAESASDDVEVVVGLADALCRAGRPQDAQKVLKGKAKAFAGSPDYHCQQGVVLDLLGEREPARAAYDKAIEIEEDHAPTLFRLAYNADLNGDDESAEELYCRCVQQQPPHINALLNLGVNARDAMPDGWMLTYATRCVTRCSSTPG